MSKKICHDLFVLRPACWLLFIYVLFRPNFKQILQYYSTSIDYNVVSIARSADLDE